MAAAEPVPDDFELHQRALAPGEEEIVPVPEILDLRKPTTVEVPTPVEPNGGFIAFPSGLGTQGMRFRTKSGERTVEARNFSRLSASITTNITNDSRQEAETTVASVDLNGQHYIITAFYKYEPVAHIHFRTTDGVSTWSGSLPLPSGYSQGSYDPYLAVNPYSNGVMPKTVYLVGNAIQYDCISANYHVAVVGWRSLNGGRNWQGPVIIATSVSSTRTNAVDKAHIAVSWHPSTRGWIYIGYSDASGRLVVHRSQNGGLSFSGPYVITSINSYKKNINGLQFLVSPFTGYLYALWNDFNSDRIYWDRSVDHGISWSARSVFPNASTPAHFLMKKQGLQGLSQAPSFPIARFNWPAGKISVVWHECNGKPFVNCIGNGMHTDVYYASIGSNGATNKIRINDDFAFNDQFMPALDFNAAGNVLATFYDRRDDPDNVNYSLYRAWINSSGYPLSGNQSVSTFSSTPMANVAQPRFLGDYHETWMSTISGMDIWYSSWVGENSGNMDIFLSTIQP